MEVFDISLEEPWKKKEFEEKKEGRRKKKKTKPGIQRNSLKTLPLSFVCTYLSSACGEEKIQAR